MDFRGFDSSTVLIYRGGILRPIGDFPESLSQAIVSRDNVSREIGRTVHYEYGKTLRNSSERALDIASENALDISRDNVSR